MKKRYDRSKEFLIRHARQNLDRIIFSDEKLFSVEESYNSQNVRVYATSFEDIPEELLGLEKRQVTSDFH